MSNLEKLMKSINISEPKRSQKINASILRVSLHVSNAMEDIINSLDLSKDELEKFKKDLIDEIEEYFNDKIEDLDNS
jgi:hypothetical protein